ncbi:HAD family hydrolase [uncultured Olsenella sp.]|uniref:HAD family hydrolase n=1 Tax=uncultured Olsenella sp. TaxID=190764 RepID=UPI0026DD42F7|nr:HAD family hydrolase [uncultured Olsenella sp.]
MRFTHVAFDLDGTLIDTDPPLLRTWQRTAHGYGLDLPLDDFRVAFGITTVDALGHLGLDVDPDEFVRRWNDDYAAFADETEYFPGARELLRDLRGHGLGLGAVTSRERDEYERFFDKFHLDDLMGQVVLADATERHKPAPDPLLRFARLAGADPARCAYVGDQPSDVQAARAAGFASCIVAWSHPHPEEAGADFVAHGFDELERWLLA